MPVMLTMSCQSNILSGPALLVGVGPPCLTLWARGKGLGAGGQGPPP
ncbi:MAG: hypothetical protein M5U34_40360 [Chloroflexi bacterium]|nr:hypothetical protein [Chloroflexota bacterium]